MLNLDHIKITPRGQQVLQLLIRGCSNKEIAAQLNISPHSVKQHLRILFLAGLVWQGMTNRDIARTIGTTEQVVKNYLRNTFDKLGVWSRLELAIYVAAHGGATCRKASAPSLLTR